MSQERAPTASTGAGVGRSSKDRTQARRCTPTLPLTIGPQAKARQWVENILGRELEAGEQIGVEDLVGGKHHLMVENVKRDGRVFDNVSTVHKYRE